MSGIDDQARNKAEKLKQELDHVTSMLCALIAALEQHKDIYLPKEVLDWYKKHKEWDRSQGR